MIMNETEGSLDKKASSQNNGDKTLVFLNAKNVNEFINYKDGILKKLLITKFDFQVIYSSGSSNSMSTSSDQSYDLKIERSLKNDKIFKLEQTIKLKGKVLKEKFLDCLSRKNKYLLHYQILENFSKKYKAVYEKYIINGRIH